MAKVAFPVDTALEALVSQPTAHVAVAVRTGADAVGPVALTPSLLATLTDALEHATGCRDWTLEHLRDSRPLGEMLEMAQLIRDQRRAASSRVRVAAQDVPAVQTRRQLRHPVRAHGRGGLGLT